MKINIKKDIEEVLVKAKERGTLNKEDLLSPLVGLFELHLKSVAAQLIDESSYGTIHIHTGRPHQFK
jgi:hypothetical protein